jgi:hypothetical protein
MGELFDSTESCLGDVHFGYLLLSEPRMLKALLSIRSGIFL